MTSKSIVTQREASRLATYPSDLIPELEQAGLLNAYQVELLTKAWPDIAPLAASPYFGTVREHTRAYLGLPSREGLEMRAPHGDSIKQDS